MNKKKIILLGLVIAFMFFFFFIISKSKKMNMVKVNKETEYFLEEAKIREEDFYKNEIYKKDILSKLKEKSKVEKKEKSTKVVIKEEVKKERLYYLQIGTFKNVKNAENLMENLSDLAALKIEKSKYNENYYVLLTENYSKKELTSIDENIKKRFKTIKPIVKVRY